MRARHSLLLAALLGAVGCSSILGLDDVTLGAAGVDGGNGDGGGAVPSLSVAVAEPMIRVERGEAADVPVTITRANGFEGAVTVDLVPASAPVGITFTSASIAAGETTGTITVTAVGDAMTLDVGARAATVQAAAGDVMGSADVTLLVADHAGVLDLSFNSSGLQISGLLTDVRRVTVGPDGQVFVLGPSKIVALAPDGTVDTNFGTNGVKTLSIEPYDLIVRDQGRILVTGDAGPQLAIRAFTATGAIDATFGSLGEVTFGPVRYSSSSGRALVQAADGTVYVGGVNGSANSGQVWRFSATGMEQSNLNLPGFTNVLGVDVQSSGLVIAAGQQDTMMVPTTVVTRLTWAGTLPAVDTTFGTSGEALVADMRMADSGFGIGDDDTIAVVGKTATGSVDIVGLLDADGGSGFTKTNQSGTSGSPWGHGAAIDTMGRVLTVAWGQSGPGGVYWSAAVLRFLTNGNLDTGFDGDGKYVFDGSFDGAPQFALYDVALAPDGRIVALGLRDGELMVARIWD